MLWENYCRPKEHGLVREGNGNNKDEEEDDDDDDDK